MIRILLVTLRRAMPHQRHQALGGTPVPFTCARTYQFGGGKSISEDVFAAISGCLNPDQPIGSGRCRATLTPT